MTTTPETDDGRPSAPWRKRVFFRLLTLYPPYLGAGVRVRRVSPQLDRFEVEMRLRWWNRNYFGTHFGGSLYSMCDPFFVLVLANQLGPGYVVWDKEATVRFRRPGRGTVRAVFQVTPEEVARIREAADRERKVEPTFAVQVVDRDGEVVADVEKLLYVRRKD